MLEMCMSDDLKFPPTFILIRNEHTRGLEVCKIIHSSIIFINKRLKTVQLPINTIDNCGIYLDNRTHCITMRKI